MILLLLHPMLSRLHTITAAAQQGHWPEELLQRRLLDQLQQVPAIAALGPEELLAEYRALQLMALYNGPSLVGGEVPAGKKKGMDSELEDFMVHQVRAML